MFLTGNIKADIRPDTTIELLENVIYQSDTDTYVVPAGYVSDGASVPRALSWMYPKYGEYLKAAVLHDWLITDLLEKQHVIESNNVDNLFREAMKSLDIPALRRWVMWAGVRIGAIGNKKRRKGSWKTLPKLLLILLVALPLAVPSLIIQVYLVILSVISIFLPKKHKITAQKM